MHVANWAHEKDCRISDPINVLWEGSKATLAQVLGHFDNMGWAPPSKIILFPEGTNQFIPAFGRKHKQSDQRLFATVPLAPLKWVVRYHVRLWETANGGVIGAAHYERIQLFPPCHRVVSFENAEQKVADHFSWPPGNWVVAPSSHPLGNQMSKRQKAYNDGKATTIQ